MTKETREEMLQRLRQELTSCRRIYKRLNGDFEVIEGYTGDHAPIKRSVNAKPAQLEPSVIIVNKEPLNLFLDGRFIAIKDTINKLTLDELDFVLPSALGGFWPQKEAEYFAAHLGSIYHYNAYVLGRPLIEVFGDNYGLKEGKLAVGVEYYYLEAENDKNV